MDDSNKIEKKIEKKSQNFVEKRFKLPQNYVTTRT